MEMLIEEYNIPKKEDSIEVLNAKLKRIGHHLKIMMKPEEYEELYTIVKDICTDKNIIISQQIFSPDYPNSCWGDIKSFKEKGNPLINKFDMIIYRKSDFYGHS